VAGGHVERQCHTGGQEKNLELGRRTMQRGKSPGRIRNVKNVGIFKKEDLHAWEGHRGGDEGTISC